MADVKELNINNTTYAIKDAVARNGLTTKQDILVSGTNIKTINNQSILGSGNITINEPILYSTTGQNTDGAMTQKAATDNFADTDLSNLSATGQKVLDGQWVVSNSTLANGVSLNAATYLDISLANYLPSDNFKYEVELQWESYGSTFARVHVISNSTTYLLNTHTASSANYFSDGCNRIVVDTTRIISLRRSSGWATTCSLTALAYRRIGTNS